MVKVTVAVTTLEVSPSAVAVIVTVVVAPAGAFTPLLLYATLSVSPAATVKGPDTSLTVPLFVAVAVTFTGNPPEGAAPLRTSSKSNDVSDISSVSPGGVAVHGPAGLEGVPNWSCFAVVPTTAELRTIIALRVTLAGGGGGGGAALQQQAITCVCSTAVLARMRRTLVSMATVAISVFDDDGSLIAASRTHGLVGHGGHAAMVPLLAWQRVVFGSAGCVGGSAMHCSWKLSTMREYWQGSLSHPQPEDATWIGRARHSEYLMAR